MIRSKQISDYFEVAFAKIKAEAPIPCDIHLYLSGNNHIIVLLKKDDSVTPEYIKKYLSRGVEKAWIHSEDRALWEYYAPPEASALANSAAAEKTATPNLPPGTPSGPAAATPAAAKAAAAASAKKGPLVIPTAPPARTETGTLLAAVVQSPSLTEKEKIAATAEIAQTLLEKIAQADTPEKQKQSEEMAKAAIQDFLSQTMEDSLSSVKEIWALLKLDPELTHAVNVATYAVCFALAFGKISPKTSMDLTMAALMHDIGFSMISGDVIATPVLQQSPAQNLQYRSHIERSIQLMTDLGELPSPEVIAILQSHHERFDGKGFPMQLQGFNLPDLSQILSMADLLETISSGLWDGKKRPLREAFLLIEAREKNSNQPEFFLPDIFDKVQNWLKTSPDADKLHQAAETVAARTRDLVEEKKN